MLNLAAAPTREASPAREAVPAREATASASSQLEARFAIEGSASSFDSASFVRQLASILVTEPSEIELSISASHGRGHVRHAAASTARNAARAAALLPDNIAPEVREALLGVQRDANEALTLAEKQSAGGLTVKAHVLLAEGEGHQGVLKLAGSADAVGTALGVRLLEPVALSHNGVALATAHLARVSMSLAANTPPSAESAAAGAALSAADAVIREGIGLYAAPSIPQRATDPCAVKLAQRARELRFSVEQLTRAVELCRQSMVQLGSGAEMI